MPEIATDTAVASCYPPESLYSDWCEHADELDMPTSQFLIRMVEAGRKDISMDEASAGSIHELQQQLNDLQKELERQRTRNKDLERQLQHTAHSEIITFVEENPGATTPQIIQHVADTVPGRVVGHLELLEGDTLELDDGAYFVRDSADEDEESEGGDDGSD
jgi:predicted RNase H-like nuclease (RuvC/YqgF family)